MTHLIRLADFGSQKKNSSHRSLFFTRPELMMLMGLYSASVMRGDWRDYALDHLDDAAIFSVFRHAHEQPLFSIVKTTAPQRKNIQFCLYRGSQRLVHCAVLGDLLQRIRDKPRLVTDT